MIDPFFGTGLTALANIGGGLITSGGEAAANAENVRMQNLMNQQTLNAQMASHAQNTAFMEDQQSFGAQQQSAQNVYNSAEAEKARAFASLEARAARNEQNQFQTEMSNTQYQRAMADMKAAGLNPILAYKMGGAGNLSGGGQQASASAASGGAASSGMASAQGAPHLTAPRVNNDKEVLGRAIGNLVSSALDAYKTTQDVSLSEQQEKESAERVRKSGYETTKLDAETQSVLKGIEKIAAETNYTNAATTNARLDALMKRYELSDAAQYGSRIAPDTRERIFRSIQQYIQSGQLPNDAGKAVNGYIEWRNKQ